MSTTTSDFHFWRHSTASSITFATASASSPFTWNTGMLMPFATSVQYGEDREYLGSVVNATWLFTTTCNVPPIVYSGS